MNTHVVAVEKNQLIQDLNAAQQGFLDAANKSMEYAFKMGDILIKLKAITPHGQFENVIKNDTRVAFGVKQAQRLIRIAAHRAFILEQSKGEALSIREMDKLISSISQVKKSAMNPEVIAEVIPVNPAISLSIFGKAGPEEILEGEFTEIKPEPMLPALSPPSLEPEQSSDDQAYGSEDREQDYVNDVIAENKRLAAENAYLREILEDDKQTARAVIEIDKLVKLKLSLEAHINTLVNENAELTKRQNWLERKNKAMQKQLKGVGIHE